MKIIITGDIHNDFHILNTLINNKKPDMVICCGDFGYWPGKPWARSMNDLKPGNIKILWCDGNHEDHWAIRDRENDEIVPNVIYMPRGSTYKLEDGRTILFMGGAYSIDKHYRKVGIDWFPEETISYTDMQNLPDCKVDIFITHTCPEELVKDLIVMYPEKGLEPSNRALSILWKKYKPSLWYFGHWHQYLEGKLGNTEWYALACTKYGGRWWTWLK